MLHGSLWCARMICIALYNRRIDKIDSVWANHYESICRFNYYYTLYYVWLIISTRSSVGIWQQQLHRCSSSNLLQFSYLSKLLFNHANNNKSSTNFTKRPHRKRRSQNCLFPFPLIRGSLGPWVHTPDGISIGSAFFAQLVFVTNNQIHTYTETTLRPQQWAESMHCVHAMRPDNDK